jgi:hypothetical protein
MHLAYRLIVVKLERFTFSDKKKQKKESTKVLLRPIRKVR